MIETKANIKSTTICDYKNGYLW